VSPKPCILVNHPHLFSIHRQQIRKVYRSGILLAICPALDRQTPKPRHLFAILKVAKSSGPSVLCRQVELCNQNESADSKFCLVYCNAIVSSECYLPLPALTPCSWLTNPPLFFLFQFLFLSYSTFHWQLSLLPYNSRHYAKYF
jgi:hypothetical protein